MTIGKAVRFAGTVAAVVGLTAIGLAAIAQAQTPAPFRIGLMEGFSGVYGDLTQGEVEAMQMAIDDFGGKVLGRPIELALGRPSDQARRRRGHRAQMVSTSTASR